MLIAKSRRGEGVYEGKNPEIPVIVNADDMHLTWPCFSLPED